MCPRIMCHHHTLSDNDREFISKKVEGLKRFFERIAEVSVILDAAKHECQVELLVFGPQLHLRVKDSADDMRTAFEGALNKAERAVSRTKEKKWGGKGRKRRNVSIRRFESTEATEGAVPFVLPHELPVEHIEPCPMSLDEAHEEMANSKSGLFVYVNPKTDEINILHHNAKGQLELVELTGTILYQPTTVDVAEGQ